MKFQVTVMPVQLTMAVMKKIKQIIVILRISDDQCRPEVTVHPTQPPKTTQPPSPPTTSAPLTTSSRVTTATDVTANQMTAAPVMSQAEVTTTVHETIASPAPTTRIHVESAAVPTDGTNATGSVTMPSRHQ
ncbi:hypothetical protein BaRGS_00039117 [Batillaria attramentaria]|uniref:Uncharacterized protein n=1 Tax=Batillaria attramentaria TaxID=370345 RepID=A0ABD0J3V8_9CAEN